MSEKNFKKLHGFFIEDLEVGQKAILKKMKEDGKLTEEESEAVTQDLLSKKNQKENEVGPEGEMKVVEKPKKDA